MSLLFPRFAYAPARSCGPARHEVAPLWSLFDDTLNEIQRASRQTRRQFSPRFDIKENKESYSLEGELPGIDQKNISVEFTDEHTLTIKGHTGSSTQSGTPAETVDSPEQASETNSVKSHQATVEDDEPANGSAAQAGESSEVAKTVAPEAPAKAEQPQQQSWLSERHYGEFSRSFSFASRVDQEAVRASLKHGILSVVVPKAAVPESRRINIE